MTTFIPLYLFGPYIETLRSKLKLMKPVNKYDASK